MDGIYPLYQRATIIRLIRNFYQCINGFIEVETAFNVAKAYWEISSKSLMVHYKDGHNYKLRIAPESWLKRHSVSGMPKFFEIRKMIQ